MCSLFTAFLFLIGVYYALLFSRLWRKHHVSHSNIWHHLWEMRGYARSVWAEMATTKYVSKKFTGKNDFGLWRIKIRAILTQQRLSDQLKGDKLFMEGEEDKMKKVKMLENAHNTIILCLGDKVLREVAREKNAAVVWSKLENMYMKKSLANRLYKKQRLY